MKVNGPESVAVTTQSLQYMIYECILVVVLAETYLTCKNSKPINIIARYLNCDFLFCLDSNPGAGIADL